MLWNSNRNFYFNLQADIKKCIGLFEDSTRLVSLTGVFSSNESFQEITTEDLKFLLLPFFLAQLQLKLCTADRKHNVEIAEIYYKDFLKRCTDYGLCEAAMDNRQVATVQNDTPRSEMEALQQMALSREKKLAQYRAKKELNDQIKQLKVAMSGEHIDDDVKREFYLTLLKSCIIESKDEIITIGQEKQILEHLAMRHAQQGHETGARPKQPLHKPKPLNPIIITKDAVQKAVYGLGYPSVPTMTVAEFYEERVRDGIFPDAAKMKDIQKYTLQGRTEEEEQELNEKEDIDTEEKIENDDPEYLERQRAKDEFKDEHRRGYGNRHNRS